MIRVLLADDQLLFRAGLRMLIDAEPDLEVVGEAGTGREAVDLARRSAPTWCSWTSACPAPTASSPPARSPTALDAVRGADPDHVRDRRVRLRALRSGASGFIGKGTEPGELLAAIRVVHRGDALLSPAATRTLIARYLTSPDHATRRPNAWRRSPTREREVLALVAAGLSNDEIADHLVLSPHTAKTHVNRAMTKLGVRDRAQLVVLAYETGLVRPRG